MIKRVLVTVFVSVIMMGGGVLLSERLYSQSGPSIQISSPLPNSSVVAGQTISVTIQPGQGTSLNQATAWFPSTAVPQVVTTPPFTISVSVPTGVSGPVILTGAAIDTVGNRLQATVQVTVVPASLPASIRVDQNSILFSQSGDSRTIGVVGTFPDGSKVDMTADPRISYISSNPLVAKIIGVGGVQAVAPGISTISVTFNGGAGSVLTKRVTVSVGVFEARGDLNGDGMVDQTDVNILLRALNTEATGPGDPRDLNGDGKIDALDSRLMVNLCTRPRCATQ
jgi:hypothetical protein